MGMIIAGAGAVANWVSASGQWVGALGTIAAVVVALRLAGRERRRDDVQRSDQEAAQARLVTIEVTYPEYGDPQPIASVAFTNHSNRPVHRPRIVAMPDARPPTRWAHEQSVIDEYELTDVLPPHTTHRVPFEHHDTNQPTSTKIECWVDSATVIFTFTDADGRRWRRTGNAEPVRVVAPA